MKTRGHLQHRKLVVLSVLSALTLGVGVAGCSATKRGQAAYRTDTQQLLATRDSQLKRCYEDALATNPTLAGTVTVRFIVKKKTGEIHDATIDPASANAAEPLVACLLQAVNGLVLAPPDANEGRATFTYEFKPTPPAA